MRPIKIQLKCDLFQRFSSDFLARHKFTHLWVLLALSTSTVSDSYLILYIITPHRLQILRIQEPFFYPPLCFSLYQVKNFAHRKYLCLLGEYMSKILNIESMKQNSTPNMISKGGNVYIALINSSKLVSPKWFSIQQLDWYYINKCNPAHMSVLTEWLNPKSLVWHNTAPARPWSLYNQAIDSLNTFVPARQVPLEFFKHTRSSFWLEYPPALDTALKTPYHTVHLHSSYSIFCFGQKYASPSVKPVHKICTSLFETHIIFVMTSVKSPVLSRQ